MNVLQIINSSGLGGAETIVKEILAKNRHHKCFCLFKDEKNRFSDFGNQVYYGLNRRGPYKVNIFLFLKLLKIIKKEKINIIHVHLAASLLYGVFVKIFKPSIVLIYHEHSEIVYSKSLKFLLSIFKNKIDLFIAVSNFLREKLIDFKINKNKIIVLYNFVNIEKYSQKPDLKAVDEAMIKYHLENKFVIGFAGRIIERKGWLELLMAFKEIVLRNDNNSSLLIAGDGPEKEKMIEFIKNNNLNSSVIYLGYFDDIRILYELSNLLILPSYWEGLPMTQLEIMAYGKPLLSSDGPGLNEIAKNGEVTYFKNKDTNDLVKKIKYCKDNYQLCLSSANDSKKLSTMHSLDEYVKSLEKIYLTF